MQFDAFGGRGDLLNMLEDMAELFGVAKTVVFFVVTTHRRIKVPAKILLHIFTCQFVCTHTLFVAEQRPSAR